jgi:hypothetical protein
LLPEYAQTGFQMDHRGMLILGQAPFFNILLIPDLDQNQHFVE